MTNETIELHEHEQSPPEELYQIVREATQERQEAVADAHTKHWEVLRSLTDMEIFSLIAAVGKHECPMDGARALVAVDLIVSQPRLAFVIAERHFDNCTSYYDAAVVPINDFLHTLWLGGYLPTEANLQAMLKAAARHRESRQRTLQSQAASDNWSDGCC